MCPPLISANIIVCFVLMSKLFPHESGSFSMKFPHENRYFIPKFPHENRSQHMKKTEMKKKSDANCLNIIEKRKFS